MSIESWDPNHAEQSQVDISNMELDFYIVSGAENAVTESSKNLTDKQIETLVPWMKQSQKFWSDIVEHLATDSIKNLIRFFTVIEEDHSALQAGNDSPVIAFNKVLKKRGEALDKNFLLWIRQHSNNRYIPNGSAL